MQTPKWLQRPKTIDEELLLAHWELLRNPTITSYKFVNGREARQAANPFARVKDSFVRMGEAMVTVQAEFKTFAEGVRAKIAEQEMRNLCGEVMHEYDGDWKGMGDF